MKRADSDAIFERYHAVLDLVADLGWIYTLDFQNQGYTPSNTVDSINSEWLQSYVATNLFSHDSVLTWTYNNSGFLNWRDWSVLEKTEGYARVLLLAEHHGLLNGTVFCGRLLGKRHAISMAHTNDELSDAEKTIIESTFLSVVKMHSQQDLNDTRSLTDRELAVFGYLLEGLSNEQIASSIGVTSEASVRKHIRNICLKYSVANERELIASLKPAWG